MKKERQPAGYRFERAGKWWSLIRLLIIDEMKAIIKNKGDTLWVRNGVTEFEEYWQKYIGAGGEEGTLCEIFADYIEVEPGGQVKLAKLTEKGKSGDKLTK